MAQAAHILLLKSQSPAPTGLELVISKALDPVQVFTASGLDPILKRIEQDTRTVVLDISTKKGREQIASLAHKITKSKTALDSAGKVLVSGRRTNEKSSIMTERYRITTLTSSVSSVSGPAEASGAPFCRAPSLLIPVQFPASALHRLGYEGRVVSLLYLRTLVGFFLSRPKHITQEIEDELQVGADCPHQDACYDYGCGKDCGVGDDEGNEI